jgi:RIO kinase 2
VESLARVLEAVRAAYMGAGLVNADLSEYNILTDGEKLWLIDWPQAVDRTHPNSGELLLHDVASVGSFFRRAYRVHFDQEDAMAYVSGRSDALKRGLSSS